jgi:hypothetical protein
MTDSTDPAIDPINAFVFMFSEDLRKIGFVALTWNGHNEPDRQGHSGGKTKELVHKTDFAYHAGACQDAVPTADHTHDLKAFEGHPRRFHSREGAGRSDHTLECAVIRLNDIVQIFRRPMLDMFRQQPVILQPLNYLGIRSQFVGCDRGWGERPYCLKGFAQETISCTRITPIRQHGIDERAVLVDSSKQRFPSPADPHVDLIHAP